MKELIFTSKEEKVVLFEPDKVDLTKEYFKNNPKAVLLITFADKDGLGIKFDNYQVINEIPNRHLLIVGKPWYEVDVNAFLNVSSLCSLDDDYLDLPYDFYDAEQLVNLTLLWNKKVKNINKIKRLKTLNLRSYRSKNKNLSELTDLVGLEELGILESNIEDISSLGEFKNLKELSLVGNPNMVFDSCDFILPNLERLHLGNCKKIEDNFITLFPNLKFLEIHDCPNLDSIKNVSEKLPGLESLELNGTPVSS